MGGVNALAMNSDRTHYFQRNERFTQPMSQFAAETQHCRPRKEHTKQFKFLAHYLCQF